MTLTPPEQALAADAAARLDEYLRQVRAALAGVPDVNPDEVEADVREHVGAALGGAPRPVSRAALDAVLAKLGPPAQWGAADAPSPLARVAYLIGQGAGHARAAVAAGARRVRLTLWNGPDDWRLAYLSFGVLAVGTLTMVGFPLALLVSYVLSRAGIAHARERGIELGAGRKWLLYPPVVLVSASLLLAVIVWPVALGVATFYEVEASRTRLARLAYPQPLRHADLNPDLPIWQEHPRLHDDRAVVAAVPIDPDFAPLTAGLFVGVGALAVWGLALGLLAGRFPNAARAAFDPLLGWLEGHHGTRLAIGSFVVLVVLIGTAVRAFDRVM